MRPGLRSWPGPLRRLWTGRGAKLFFCPNSRVIRPFFLRSSTIRVHSLRKKGRVPCSWSKIIRLATAPMGRFFGGGGIDGWGMWFCEVASPEYFHFEIAHTPLRGSGGNHFPQRVPRAEPLASEFQGQSPWLAGSEGRALGQRGSRAAPLASGDKHTQR